MFREFEVRIGYHLLRRVSAVLLLLGTVSHSAGSRSLPTAASLAQSGPTATRDAIPDYQITVSVDYAAATLTGHQIVSFSNSSRETVDSVSLHLYPNLGLEDERKPHLVVHGVASLGRELQFSIQARAVLLKVNLGRKLAPGERTSLEISFSASIPRVEPNETSLLAHFLEEVSDAMGEQRGGDASREIFFAGDGGILLGYFFPMLAAGEGQELDRLPATGIKSAICAEVADYRVSVSVSEGIDVIGSGEVIKRTPIGGEGKVQQFEFAARRMRSFALILASGLKSASRTTGKTTVISYFRPGSERLGSRLLNLSIVALETFSRTFGSYDWPTLQVVEFGLPASFSGIDLPGIVILAQAYYLDFESPQSQLPGIVRSQSDIIKAALDFTLAHEIGHQWWGGMAGSDPQRVPFLDESLAHFSAIYLAEVVDGPEAAAAIVEQQVRGTYFTYRMFGGTDVEVDRSLREIRSRLQYAAIAQSKGAFFLLSMRRQLGDQKFFAALRKYFSESRNAISTPDRLRTAFLAEAEDPRALRLVMRRWLNERHADEDIGNPGTTLVTQDSTGIRKLGRIFVWIGRAAARPF